MPAGDSDVSLFDLLTLPSHLLAVTENWAVLTAILFPFCNESPRRRRKGISMMYTNVINKYSCKHFRASVSTLQRTRAKGFRLHTYYLITVWIEDKNTRRSEAPKHRMKCPEHT